MFEQLNINRIDHSKQVSIEYYLEKVLKLKNYPNSLIVLDLGCGTGESFYYFKSLNSNVEWYGIDLEKSPEVSTRKKWNDRFISFDGIKIPFSNNYFDIIYCRQVLEHVKHPRQLLAEVSRVLKLGGYFVGSTSHLEPYHSLSYWNYTPLGFKTLVEEVNLDLLEIRPSIDSLTLIIRRIFRCSKLFDIFWRIESPLNIIITLTGKVFRLSALKVNSIKLLFCGQFIFFVKKEK